MTSEALRSRRSRIAGRVALVVVLVQPAFAAVGSIGEIPTADAQSGGCHASLEGGSPTVACSDRFGGGGGEADTSGGGGSGSGGGSGGGGEPPECIWRAFEFSQLSTEVQEWLRDGYAAPSFEWDGQQWWWKSCLVGGQYHECPASFDIRDEGVGPSPSQGDDDDPVEPTACYDFVDDDGSAVPAWVTEAPDGVAAPVGVDPEVFLLQVLWRRVGAKFGPPELATDPAEGVPAIIDVPSFVEVTNWSDEWDGQDSASVSLPDGEVSLTMWWESSLWFRPGEPGSGEFECDPPGSRYDLDGPEPRDQVVTGTCAHAYQHRTTSGGGHEATVTVNFDVSWESSEGWSGEFDTIREPTSFERTVDEVQTQVTDFPELEEAE